MITKDDIADMALRSVDQMVEQGLLPDCIDTDDETEFEAQDIIREQIELKLNQLGIKVTGGDVTGKDPEEKHWDNLATHNERFADSPEDDPDYYDEYDY